MTAAMGGEYFCWIIRPRWEHEAGLREFLHFVLADHGESHRSKYFRQDFIRALAVRPVSINDFLPLEGA